MHAVSERPFLVWEGSDSQVRTWTYEDFDRVVARVAGGLLARGVGKGDAVHLVLRNSPAFVACWLACSRLGAWIVPSDPQATARELREHITRTKPRVGVCSVDAADRYQDASLPEMAVILVEEDDTTFEPLVGDELTTDRSVNPRDRAAVMFTSGTTSAPKGVVVTQANYAFAGDVMAAAAALTRWDRQLVVLPLFHANAQYYSFASAISAGASVALMHAFSASRFVQQAARHGATHASLFAAPMRMILAKDPEPLDGIRLRHVWYAQNVTSQQYSELTGLFGCQPRQLYGMTETIPAVLTSRALGPLPNSMGVPTLGCEVELFDADGTDRVEIGQIGEVAVRGEPGITLFSEYLDDPTTTAASFRNGWFRTGDLARRDEHGRFYFSGRRSDVLKVAGENVSVVEVEEVLASHPSVLEAAVVGRPDTVRDEVPVAYVVATDDTLSTQALEEFCTGRLAPSKRPRDYHFVDELPRTSVGKIRKFLLDPSNERMAHEQS